MQNNNNDSSSTYTAAGINKKPSQKSLKELIAQRRSQVSKVSPTSFDVIMDPYEAVINYRGFKIKGTGYIEQESAAHYCLWDKDYPENPERVAYAKKRLEALDLIKRCETITPLNYTDEVFLKKHSNSLYERLKNCSQLSMLFLHEESTKWDAVYLTQDTYREAKLAAEAAVSLTLKVASGDLKNGFALIRPPGHHAMENAFCGYCFINNVAVAAEAAITEGLAKKILIVDYDVHHGQGTQQMFYNRNDVLYFSIHRYEHGEFWPNLRESDSDYIGAGDGKGFNVNVPLNATGLDDSDYLAIVLNLLLPLAYEFNPELILISAGYDAAIGCPEGKMNVTPHFYGHLVTLLSGLANGKIVVCLEGGYFKESLAEGVACTLKALLGDVCYPLDIPSNTSVHPCLQEVINNVKYFLHDHWECFKTEPLFNYPRNRDTKCLNYEKEEEHVTCLDFKHVEEEVTVYATVECYPVHSKEEYQQFLNIIETLREEYLRGRTYKDIIGYVYDDELLNHKPTSDTGKSPPEGPERLLEIMKELEEFGLRDRCRKIDLCQFDEKYWLERVHGAEYLRDLFNQENLNEKPDWYYNSHTTSCLLKCVSNILSLAKSISDGSIRAGVAIIRPPGHHATSSSGSGFCFINNVVIVAEFLIQEQHYKRVLIVDFDIHHGNGTQELTYGRSDIMYISIHRFDESKFFPSSHEADVMYTGEGSAKGFNVNIPFNKGTKSDADYWTVWHKIVLPLSYSFNPDFVIISAGFDAGMYDPLGGGYQVTPEMYGHLVQTLKPLSSGKILLALEGGYNVKTTALSMISCVKALLGDPLPVPKFSKKVTKDTLDTVQKVVNAHKIKWPLLQVNKRLANFCCTAEQKRKLKELVYYIVEGSQAANHFDEIVQQCTTSSE